MNLKNTPRPGWRLLKTGLLTLLLGITFTFGLAQAAEYSQNFDGFANGTTDLGDGTIIGSSVDPTVTEVVDGALRLTQEGVESYAASFKIPALGPEQTESFSVKFDAAFSGGGAQPADGFSVNIGDIPFDASTHGSEEGYGIGLAVEFDTWDNDGEGADNGIGIDVSVDGVTVDGAMLRAPQGADPTNNEFFQFDGVFRTYEIRWEQSAGGGVLNVLIDDEFIYEDLEVPGFTPTEDDIFAITGRTGGATETLLFDNFQIDAPAAAFEPRDPWIASEKALRIDGVEPGTTVTESLPITNRGAAEDLVITADSAITGSSASTFSIVTTLPLTIAPGETVDLDIEATNEAVGTFTADLVLATNDSSPKQQERRVALSVRIIPTGEGAVTYQNNFDGYPENVTDLGDGSSLTTNMPGAAGTENDTLRLTQDGTGDTLSGWVLPALGEQATESWRASFDFALSGGGSRPADGFSFNFGAITAGQTASEAGFGTGLAVEFDTWDNEGEGFDNGIGIDLSVDGVAVEGAQLREEAGADPTDNQFFKFDGEFRSVEVLYQQTGATTAMVTVIYDGDTLFEDQELTNIEPAADWTFAFGARTGGAHETLLLDNVDIATPSSTPVTPPLDRDPEIAGDRALSLVASTGSERTSSVMVTNVGESSDLILSAAEITGADAASFSFDAEFPLTVEPGGSVAIPVTFTAPATVGTFSASLVITNNDTLERARTRVVNLDGLTFEGDGSYSQSFDAFADGTTDLGDGSTIASNNGVASVQNQALQLTEDGTDSSTSGFVLPFIGDGGNQAFIVTFDLALESEGTPADGLALTYGQISPGATGSESGIGVGLSVQFDSYDNGPDAEQGQNGIGYDIAVDGTIVPDGSSRVEDGADTLNNTHYQFDGEFRPVEISWFRTTEDSGLLTLIVDGETFFEDLPTPGFTPKPTYRFGFGARTGGANETVLLDNLNIITGTEDPNLFVRNSLDSGVVQPDAGVQTLQIPIRNTGTDTQLELTSITLQPADSAVYALGNVPSSLAPGEQGIIEVTLDPSQVTGLATATVTIESNDPSTPVTEILLSVSVPVSSDLEAWYTFDELSGTDVLDASGNGRHGRFVTSGGGTFSLGADSLASGTAVSLSPGDGSVYAQIPGFPALQTLSISVWAQREGANATDVHSLFSKEAQEESPYSLALFTGFDNSLIWVADEDADNTEVSAAGVSMAEPTHIVVVHEDQNGTEPGATATRIYVDGVLAVEITDSLGFADSEGSLQIGARLADNPFAGILDDLQVYNRVLTAEEVEELHENPGTVIGAGDPPPPVGVDTDGDGVPDHLEAIAGTDPNDPTSYFRSTQANRDADGFTFTWTSVADKTYRIDYSTTLTGDWEDLGTVPSEGDTTSFTDTDAGRLANPEGYYRVEVTE